MELNEEKKEKENFNLTPLELSEKSSISRDDVTISCLHVSSSNLFIGNSYRKIVFYSSDMIMEMFKYTN